MPLGVTWGAIESQLVVTFNLAVLGLLVAQWGHVINLVCRAVSEFLWNPREPPSGPRGLVGRFVDFVRKWTVVFLLILDIKPKNSSVSTLEPVADFVDVTEGWAEKALNAFRVNPQKSPILLRVAYGGILLPVFVVMEVTSLTLVTGFEYANYILTGTPPEMTSSYQMMLGILLLFVFSALAEAHARFE